MEQSLENCLASGWITFEEYVEALPADSAAPKGKLTGDLAKAGDGSAASPISERGTGYDMQALPAGGNGTGAQRRGDEPVPLPQMRRNTEDDGTANSGGQSANTNAKSAHEGRIAGGAY